MTRRSIKASLSVLYGAISPERRSRFLIVLALVLIGAVAEFATIGSIIPFIAVLTDPDKFREIGWVADFLGRFGLTSDADLAMFAGGTFLIVALISGAIRLVMTWVAQRFVFGIANDIGSLIQRRLLFQPYFYHVSHNSSALIGSLEKVQVLSFFVLQPAMLALSSAVISIFIVGFLVYLEPIATLIAAASFLSVYVIVSLFTKQRLARNSKIINDAYAQRVKILQESIGGIRDVIIDQSQNQYAEEFRSVDASMRGAQATNSVIGMAPRYIIETAAMVVMAAVALILANRADGLVAALPVIGALAIGAQRLLPMMQQVYLAFVQLRANADVIVDIADLVSLPENENNDADILVAFERSIKMDALGFSYADRENSVLSDINFEIQRGSSTAFIGKTGSGKSTLIDLFMGLLTPTSGSILVDGIAIDENNRRDWQRKIAHVPQSIFLSDSSIAHNISGGDPEAVDMPRVLQAAKDAQLDEFVQSLAEGYETSVGERGVQLSGGQRQRLGIARALFRKPEILVLDEATSALDNDTESAVMAALDRSAADLTVIMIAHRLSTVAGCDMVIRLDAGEITAMGTYNDVVVTESDAPKEENVKGTSC